MIKAASAILLLSKYEEIVLCVWKMKEVQKTVMKTKVLGKMKGKGQLNVALLFQISEGNLVSVFAWVCFSQSGQLLDLFVCLDAI